MTTITNADDLRDVYMLAFDDFAISPGDVTDKFEHINMRYARELLGTLQHANLLVLTEDESGDGELWQPVQSYDDVSRADAKATVDAWLGDQSTLEPATKAKTKDKPKSKSAKAKPAKKDEPTHSCYCGCGAPVSTRVFYRPGHDARHAGQVGRAIAERYAEPGFDRRELLGDLPSERLTAKAEAIAEKAIAKMEAKAAKTKVTEPEPEYGIIKVGKNEYPATKIGDKVTYIKGEDEKVASKTAASTFQPA